MTLAVDPPTSENFISCIIARQSFIFAKPSLVVYLALCCVNRRLGGFYGRQMFLRNSGLYL